MTTTELEQLLFHHPDALDVFMKGFWVQCGFELVGLTIATIRLMRNHGN